LSHNSFVRGWTLLVGLAAVAVSVFIGSQIAANEDIDNLKVSIGGVEADFPWHKLVASAVYTVFISVMNIVYAKVGESLTHWENHRTVSQFETHLAVKTIFFQFVNCYVSIFYLTLQGKRHELQLQLFNLLTVKPVVECFVEFLLPEMKFRWKLWKRGLEFAEDGDAGSANEEELFATLGLVLNWQPGGFISAAKAIKCIKFFSFLTAVASAVLIALRINAGIFGIRMIY
jgi:hypothetical protein